GHAVLAHIPGDETHIGEKLAEAAAVLGAQMLLQMAARVPLLADPHHGVVEDIAGARVEAASRSLAAVLDHVLRRVATGPQLLRGALETGGNANDHDQSPCLGKGSG